jgi:DNA replication and repair protein RecF
VRLTRLTLSNFRCFTRAVIPLTDRHIVVEGDNGVGKSSLLEALYFCGHLKSFRHAKKEDVVHWDASESPFFIELQAELDDGEPLCIQIGVGPQEKRIRVNGKAIATHKELFEHIRVVALAEHDLGLIQEGPEGRRVFMNQLCVLQRPDDAQLFIKHRHIVNQRNQLLQQGIRGEALEVWTEQLWQSSRTIQEVREQRLAALMQKASSYAEQIGVLPGKLSARYAAKHELGQDFSSFWQRYTADVVGQEYHLKRTLFGAHLDDCTFLWNEREVRHFASRGQQKLFLLLLKTAMAHEISISGGQSRLLLLLDDFITDLDATVVTLVLQLIESMGASVVVSTPLKNIISFSGASQVITLPLPERECDTL